ncbi:MAG: hypothetical protein SF053_07230 [Bacteroidia bacterium]|nr:hypothetical protein [Bacteroidia bacterium]
MKQIPSFLRLFTALILMSWASWGELSAQTVPVEDVIYLRNGGIARGKIVEQVPHAYVKIEIPGGSSLIFNTHEILRITRETPLYALHNLKKYAPLKPIQYHEHGLYGILSLHWNFYENNWGTQVSMGLQGGAGYKIRPNLGITAVTGIEGYQGGNVMPLLAGVQGRLLHKRISPMYYAAAGYGFPVSQRWNVQAYQGGLNAQAGVGILMYTRSRRSWTMSLGYKMQHTYEEFQEFPQGFWDGFNWIQPPPVTVTGTRLNQRIAFTLGLNL